MKGGEYAGWNGRRISPEEPPRNTACAAAKPFLVRLAAFALNPARCPPALQIYRTRPGGNNYEILCERLQGWLTLWPNLPRVSASANQG